MEKKKKRLDNILAWCVTNLWKVSRLNEPQKKIKIKKGPVYFDKSRFYFPDFYHPKSVKVTKGEPSK